MAWMAGSYIFTGENCHGVNENVMMLTSCMMIKTVYVKTPILYFYVRTILYWLPKSSCEHVKYCSKMA